LEWKTLKVRFEDPICFIQFNRPEAKNTINEVLIRECTQVMKICKERSSIVIFEGSPEVFCFGADLQEVDMKQSSEQAYRPDILYDLWLKMTNGPFVTISHVRGTTNAGGVGFVAASDIVIADETAVFSLSELLFGLYPAMVLPFLTRKIGYQRAHYLTLKTNGIDVKQAHNWGLVDAYQAKSNVLLKQHLTRLTKLPKSAIQHYKNYMGDLNDMLIKSKNGAVTANQQIFTDKDNLSRIYQFVENGVYPWEG
jgi:polyketide biosynthesis enoyl-CoA hydratase PksH